MTNLIFLLLLSAKALAAQPAVSDWLKYKADVADNPNKELTDVKKAIPDIVLDIRYATTNNFTKQKLYNKACAFARKPAVEALAKAQQEFKKRGAGIVVYDAYRPYSVTKKMFEIYPDVQYVADPAKGSRHNRGCAIDMGLIDLKTKKILKMPTEYDAFQKEAWPRTPVKDAEARAHRALIISVMEKHGFKVNSSEWWHFDFIGWKKYELLDIEFELLENEK